MLVRYYGHVGQASGYGDAGNEICMALLAAGFDLEISTTGDRLPERFAPLVNCIRDEAALSPDPDVILVHTLPLTCGAFLVSHRMRERFPRARCVAYTTWEGAAAAPIAVTESLRQFDQVWVPCDGTANALVAGGLHHVDVVPHPFAEPRSGIAEKPCPKCDLHHALDAFPIGAPVITPQGDGTVVEFSQYNQALYFRVELVAGGRCSYQSCELRRAPSGGGPYRFYYIGAWNVRKNPEGLVRAYCRAFDRSDNVDLMLMCSGAPDDAATLARLATGVPSDQGPIIHIETARVSDHHIRELHTTSHCFVSASRGESWNLPCFDAMLAGRHIIVPDYQGSDIYLTGTSAERYGSRLAPAGGEMVIRESVPGAPGMVRAQYVGTQGLTVREDWREPDLAALAVRMRRAYVEHICDLQINYNPAERFGRQAVAQSIRHLLQGD